MGAAAAASRQRRSLQAWLLRILKYSCLSRPISSTHWSAPEAQTRWECLDALTYVVSFDSRPCDKAIPGAEAALFDEDSGPLRLAAMRFLCKLGATTEKRSEKVWPLIDEGIQCYHGDLEFQDMLLAVIDFSQGKLDGSVKSALADRMRFDAENGKGMLKRRANQIIENVA